MPWMKVSRGERRREERGLVDEERERSLEIGNQERNEVKGLNPMEAKDEGVDEAKRVRKWSGWDTCAVGGCLGGVVKTEVKN